ncbi:DUF1140 family protein [Enterococcus avium]|uniref:DUF1140 family protein n=1 Tax=Enterococcus avium TaxID=33945 RepID=UPI0032E4E8B9
MDLMDRYYGLILKEQVKILKQYVKKKNRADQIIQELALTPSHTTQKYWQAVSQSELCIVEIEKIKNEMNYLDEKYNWKNLLHQDRFKFIDEDVLKVIN